MEDRDWKISFETEKEGNKYLSILEKSFYGNPVMKQSISSNLSTRPKHKLSRFNNIMDAYYIEKD